MTPRRFPPPWTVDESDACFIVRDKLRVATFPLSHFGITINP